MNAAVNAVFKDKATLYQCVTRELLSTLVLAKKFDLFALTRADLENL
jgi:hypothetical protein